MKVDVEETSAGVRIRVAHDESDSLAVIEVTHRYNKLMLRSGLRGNLDASKRPMRWMSTSLEAPLVSARDRLERFYAYARRRPGIDPDQFGRLAKRLWAEVAREES